MSGRPNAELVLSEAKREQLTALTMRRKTAQALALRARIVLALAEGADNKTVAAKLRVTQQTVSKWRGRYVLHRLDGLLDAPRPGAPRSINDAHVDAVIAKMLESVPKGATHWSARTMAREMSLSQTAVSRIWRAFGLQPRRQETFKLSSDPLFVDKVREIVGLYLDPPLKAMSTVCRREEPDPGVGPYAAYTAVGAWHSRASHSRLHAPRHHHIVCRAGRCHRRSDR
jgi:transposase